MAKHDSWQQIANRLAMRLVHATCPEHDGKDDGCPFCRDVNAFRVWAKKAKYNPPAGESDAFKLSEVPYDEAVWADHTGKEMQ